DLASREGKIGGKSALFPAHLSPLPHKRALAWKGRNRRSGGKSPSGVEPLDRFGYVHRLGELREVGDSVNGVESDNLVVRKHRREPVVTVAKDLPALVVGHFP
ncbi:MAG: hypothetical protein QME60_04405, partial [Verrucomicrobiota bacterium]|nr:hypothetical protein [Verrucomicrobiota bacterium]